MKLTSILKVLGAAAAVAGLTPYKVLKDEKTGEVKATALLWNAAYTPAAGSAEKKVVVNVGLNVPNKDEEETHIYADDVTVSYVPEEDEDSAPVVDVPDGQPADASAREPENVPAEEEAPAAEPKTTSGTSSEINSETTPET